MFYFVFVLQENDLTDAIWPSADELSYSCPICSNISATTTPKWRGPKTGRSTAPSVAKVSPPSPVCAPTRLRWGDVVSISLFIIPFDIVRHAYGAWAVCNNILIYTLYVAYIYIYYIILYSRCPTIINKKNNIIYIDRAVCVCVCTYKHIRVSRIVKKWRYYGQNILLVLIEFPLTKCCGSRPNNRTTKSRWSYSMAVVWRYTTLTQFLR